MMAPIAASLIASMATLLMQPVAPSHESRKMAKGWTSFIISIAYNNESSGKRTNTSRKRI